MRKILAILFLFCVLPMFGQFGLYKNALDNPTSLDAFGRVRVSNPVTLFDGQFTYDLQPILFDTLTSGGTITYNPTNRDANLRVDTAGDEVCMQTFEHFRYQPGKSQQIFVTFNMHGGSDSIVKYVGYSDGTNGIRFVMLEQTPAFILTSGTSTGNDTALQGSWNVANFQGDNAGIAGDPDGIVLDFAKTQICVIQFQALYVGEVSVGFNIGGQTYIAHIFNHSNVSSYPYIQSANLPVQAGMTAIGNVTDSMSFVCSNVNSEGGQEVNFAYQFSAEGTASAGDGVYSHVISIQPKLTFAGIGNHAKIELTGINLINVGSNDVVYTVCLGDTLSGVDTASVSDFSAVETLTGGTTSGHQIAIDQLYAAGGTNQSPGGFVKTSSQLKYPITLDMFGAHRDLGRVTVKAKGIGGTSGVRVSIQWREIR